MIRKTEGWGFGKTLISVLAVLLSLCIGGRADALPVTRADDDPVLPAPGSFRYVVLFANHGDSIVFSGEVATVVLADQVTIDTVSGCIIPLLTRNHIGAGGGAETCFGDALGKWLHMASQGSE